MSIIGGISTTKSLLIIQTCHDGNLSLSFYSLSSDSPCFSFWVKILCSPSWPLASYIVEDDLELPILQPLTLSTGVTCVCLQTWLTWCCRPSFMHARRVLYQFSHSPRCNIIYAKINDVCTSCFNYWLYVVIVFIPTACLPFL